MNSFRLKPKVIALLLLHIAYLVGLSDSVRAEDTTSEQSKAVVEVSEELGFKLSPKAVQIIGVLTRPSEATAGSLTLPKSALVNSLDQLAVYRLRDRWFKLVIVTLASTKGDLVTVRTSDIQASDQIVIQGVALLRVSDMEAFGGGE